MIEDIAIIQLKEDILHQQQVTGKVFDQDVNLGIIPDVSKCHFINCIFSSSFLISSRDVLNLTFIGCKISKLKTETASHSGLSVSVEDDSNIEEIVLGRNGHLRVTSSNIKRIYGQPDCKITIENSSTIGRIEKFISLKIEESKVEKVVNQNGGISSMFSTIEEIEMNNSRNCEFESGTIKNLIINNDQGTGTVLFRNVNNLNLIRIHSSDLSKYKFVRCNLLNCILEVTKSDLSKLKFDSVSWPKRPFVKIINEELDSIGTNLLEDQLEAREVYRHLKISAIENKDRVYELRFYALEMAAYYKSLRWRTTPVDKFSLWVSKVTNYYGLNWLWPIWWYLGLTFLVYTIYYSVDNGFNLQTMYCAVDFGRMFNPTRNFQDFESILPVNAGRVLLDFFLRIIQGLLVYQTISAFRKFFK